MDDIYLNIGCHTSFFMFPKPWVNIDKNDLAPIIQRRCTFQHHDITTGIPYGNNTVSLIYHSDIFEHLSYHEATAFLNECHRVMKPDSLMRVCVPDLAAIIESYNTNNLDEFNDIQPAEYQQAKSGAIRVSMLLFGSLGSTQSAYQGHQMMYDATGLKEMLSNAGFVDVEQQEVDNSQSPLMYNKDVHRDVELIMECRK